MQSQPAATVVGRLTKERQPPPAAPRGSRSGLRWIGPRNAAGPLTIFAVLLTLTLVGLPYYRSPIQRVRSVFHPWLKPTGSIRQSAGILAFALFVSGSAATLRCASWSGSG